MIFDLDLYLSVDTAFTKLLQYVKSCQETEFIQVFDSRGYVLKEDIVSKNDLPQYPSSHMDGFALKSIETYNASESNPISFIISRIRSILGNQPTDLRKPGEAFRIQTGGYLPYQSDAI